jgi:hypothetical protein
VKHVLNYVGSSDGVVAFLPGVFEALRLRALDVGGAGAFGFSERDDAQGLTRTIVGEKGERMQLTEFRYVFGGHGAAISEPFWPEIADFVLFGNPPKRTNVPREHALGLLFRCAPVLTALGIVVAAVLVTLPFSVVGVTAAVLAATDVSAWVATTVSLAGLAGSLFVSWFVGRFLRAW